MSTPFRITSPNPNTIHYITANAEWPSIPIQTNAVLSHGQQLTWYWSIRWSTFAQSGSAKTEACNWDPKEVLTNFGGVLNVRVVNAKGEQASVAVQILGRQPDRNAVMQYLASKPNSVGMDKLLDHETGMKHFDAGGSPKKSFDGGFGIAQLTNPKPTYQQVWNWKLNIGAALTLYQKKQYDAIKHLSQQNRSYTNDQLTYETVSRWNGGPYHTWDAKQGWIRNPNVLCDTKTGNIGWNMTDPENAEKTEADLHRRDALSYRSGPGDDSNWGYYGVCYADRVLG